MTKSATGSERVFVYGTLRTGGSNAFRMRDGLCLGEAWAEGDLWKISWYPGLVLRAGGARVRGEVWEVSKEVLAELDAFEGLAVEGLEGQEYRRVRAEVAREAGVEEVWLWEWIGRTEGLERVEGGDWLVVEVPSDR